ncbi:aspartyl protease family protein 1-like isoform X2 [Rutidosis leptorrhynchoides]|uniref:aspartyl protease family protein 1-like isoform X2 n=1 Tax=Rutidosis leptorrhynchoides TaxID=125765 RepID=UPI003A9A0090
MGFGYNSVLILIGLIFLFSKLIDGFGTYGYDIHHRYSDPVKGILDIDDHDLPKMGSLDYYSAMAHRDRIFHGRRLAGAGDPTVESSLAFLDGNVTYELPSLGFLHYANVSVGTPSLWFLVALDTGSDLFWIPCDCRSCVKGLVTRSGRRVDFNIYSPNTSSTSEIVPCKSSSCKLQQQCSARPDICPYQVNYLSSNTSSTGILIEDDLHLTTENSSPKAVDAKITFGCGMIQTGSFLDGAAPNGLFGLGMENSSVPSILANSGLAANSFSMCFSPDGAGRINFGDKGTSDQGETPINLHTSHKTYNISMTQVVVGDNVTDVNFDAIFDTGTSFSYLNDPAYSIIVDSFASQTKETRSQPSSDLPFEYCFDVSPNQQTFEAPMLNLTMKGGDQFAVTDPIVEISLSEDGSMFCLGIVKSEDVNIIGQNFMTGYRVVFDREKNILGWKASNCYNSIESNTLPISPRGSPSSSPSMSVGPEATSKNGSPISTPAQPGSIASTLSYTCFAVVISILVNLFMFVSL